MAMPASIQYGPWTMGVRYDLAPEDIPPTGLSDVEGVRLNSAAAAEKVLGTTSYQSLAALAGTPTLTAAGEFQIPNSTKEVFIVAGDKFYEYHSSAWTDRTGSVTITAGDDNTWEWVRAYDNLVLCNGVDTNAFKWDGSTSDATDLDVDSRFTKPKHVAFWDNRLWVGGENTNADRVWHSDAGDIETWGASSFYNLGSPVTAVVPMQNALAIHTEDAIHTLIPTGNATIPYQLQQRTSSDPNNPQRGGTLSARATVTLPGNVQLFPLDDGIYMWGGGDTIQKVSHALDIGYWDDVNVDRLGQSFAVYYAKENEVWFWLPHGSGQTNMNHVMIMSTKHTYADPITGEQRFAWMGPLTGSAATFERNCAAIIDNKPHAGTFGGKLLDHQPSNTYNHETAAYTSMFETGAPPPIDSATRNRWLFARHYYDALGSYTLSVTQEGDGLGTNSTTLTTTGGGAALDSFVLDTDTLGSKRMVSKTTRLRGYDPHSSIKYANNNADESFRLRRTHLQFKPTGRPHKAEAGVL